MIELYVKRLRYPLIGDYTYKGVGSELVANALT